MLSPFTDEKIDSGKLTFLGPSEWQGWYLNPGCLPRLVEEKIILSRPPPDISWAWATVNSGGPYTICLNTKLHIDNKQNVE